MALQTPEGYRALKEDDVASYLAEVPAIRERLGGDPGGWRASEVGDGNLNLVFLVAGERDGVCVKQALPYVRLVGEGWPLGLERASFEHAASVIQARHAGGLTPEPLHYDPKLFLFVMERLEPHIIMRRGMIDGVVYERFADHVSAFLARTLYFTSDLAMRAGEKKALVARFAANVELCKITEDLVFTDPYTVSARNRWTSPELDAVAEDVRRDEPLKRAAARLKLGFLSRSEALLHGDLHTGSIMVTADDTRVIDPEFAFVGPMAFDVGKLIGNLLMSAMSQRGHEKAPGERAAYRDWILRTTEELWNLFAERFLALWAEHPTGDAFPPTLFGGEDGAASLATARDGYMRGLFVDALGYAGCAMIRRTLGLAHNIDMEWIEDRTVRAGCERRNIELARELVVGAALFPDIEAVTARARAVDARP